MVDYIQPLELETWITQVFAGSPDVFIGVALMVVMGLAGFFKMNTMMTGFMMGLFFLMFWTFVSTPLVLVIAIFGGLGIGYSLAKIFS